MNATEWIDPMKAIWGSHVHQELTDTDFAKGLVIQEACAQFLRNQGVIIDAEDAIKAGYGPHIEAMWELRLESQPRQALKNLGLALAFMCVNRCDLNTYIHPLMHNPNLEEDLLTEGLKNQANTLWFGEKIEQNQTFFFDPPRDQSGKLIDTRSSRIYSVTEKRDLYRKGKKQLAKHTFVDPYKAIKNGFHIHVDFKKEQQALGQKVFDAFVTYLKQVDFPPTSTRHYQPKENGPHMLGGWEVKFETTDPAVFEMMGTAVGWLMCNRQTLSVFIHPVSWNEGDHLAEIVGHEAHAMFIDALPPLDLTFFSDKLISVAS